jgi:hypothetical protein
VMFITYKDFKGESGMDFDSGSNNIKENHDDFDNDDDLDYEDIDEDWEKFDNAYERRAEGGKGDLCERILRNTTSRRVVTNNVMKLKWGVMKFILALNALESKGEAVSTTEGSNFHERKAGKDMTGIQESLGVLRNNLCVIYSIGDFFDDFEETQASTSPPSDREHLYELMESKAGDIVCSCHSFLIEEKSKRFKV